MIDKSVIIVGNGASLKDSGLGKKIDEFDEVVRINEFKTKFFEDDAGTRTTIWSTFNPDKRVMKFIKSYQNRYNLSNMEIREIVKDIREVWYVGARFDCARQWKSIWLGEIGLQYALKRHESPLTVKKIKRDIDYPTTGFVLIWLLSSMYDKIYLAGFDFGGITDPSLEYHHYFHPTPKYTEDTHNFYKEYEYVNKLIEQGRVEHLTLDSTIHKGRYLCEDELYLKCDTCSNFNKLYSWENRICHYCEDML